MSDLSATGEWSSDESAALPVVPGYEILQELGRGGMGIVYRARQTATQRLVALKLIRDGAFAGAAVRGRFRIEAEAAARMRHPNIVEIVDVGRHDGQPYLAMELVEGGGLDQRLQGRPQPARQAAAVIRVLAEAVHHAHEQNVVHRDLKPANVMVAARGAHEPTAADYKLTDFGLAKRLDSDSTAWTHDGAVLGTVQYMAPEQAAGRANAIGPAVDVYALGAILYEMLTGRPPFCGGLLGETIRQVLHDEPPLPTELAVDVPAGLEAICLTCLEKAPERRYRTAALLAGDLERFLDGAPVTARIDSDERFRRLARRDGYEIVAEIGRGPRSIVYRAIYEPLRQPVVLKRFQSGRMTRDEWETCQKQSGEVWAAVTHSQIVAVHHSGWLPDAPYVAFDYCPAGSLAAMAARGRLPIDQAVRIVAQLAEVVIYLHRQGVVHGNLKPQNVLLGGDGIPRLSDLHVTGGLFHGRREWHADDPDAVRFLAPETIRQPDADRLPTVDVYGIGLILYELLAGRPAFEEPTTAVLLEQIPSQEPPPPSQFANRVPPELDGCCRRCLRKQPSRRYLRVFDLLKRLKAFEASQPDRSRRR